MGTPPRKDGLPLLKSQMDTLNVHLTFQFTQFVARTEELWMRYDGWGFGADECHAGYAFLK